MIVQFNDKKEVITTSMEQN